MVNLKGAMTPQEKRSLLLSFKSQRRSLSIILAILERQLPDAATPEAFWEWEEMSEGPIGASLAMLEEKLEGVLRASREIREQLSGVTQVT